MTNTDSSSSIFEPLCEGGARPRRGPGRRLALGLLLLLAAMATVSVPAAAIIQTPWFEDFTNTTPGAPIPDWKSHQSGGLTYTSIYYSHTDSYAYISMTALPDNYDEYGDISSEGWVLSPEIQCDLSTCDTLEIRMADLTYQKNTAWSVWLLIKDNTAENRNPYEARLQPGTNGASGVFTYSLKNIGFTGRQTCWVKIVTRLTKAGQGVLVVDYIRLHAARPYRSGDFIRDGMKKSYENFWLEDFRSGQAGDHVDKWWDSVDDLQDQPDKPPEMNASITYLGGGPGARVEKLAAVKPNPSYKVNAPGVYWDPNQYPLIRVGLTGISPGTRCVVVAMEIANSTVAWRQCEIGQANEPGNWVFDVHNTPDWPWPQKSRIQMLCLQFYIVSDRPSGDYYDLAYVAMSRELTPAPLNHVVKTYATPNPFFPLRGQHTTFHFETENLADDYRIFIYNMKGQRVRDLHHTSFWDGRDSCGKPCEGGVYLYQVEQQNRLVSGQITLIR